MGWVYILIAGILEVLFTTAIRYTEGFTRFWPTLLVLMLASFSFLCIARATQTIPLGTAYALWGALGAAGTVVIGILYFNEPVTFWRLFFLTTLIASVIGLKVVSD